MASEFRTLGAVVRSDNDNDNVHGGLHVHVHVKGNVCRLIETAQQRVADRVVALG